MKFCSSCSQTLPLSEFGRKRAEVDGLQRYCRTCVCRASREWRARNRDAVNARARERRALDPEGALQRDAAQRAINPERRRELDRSRYAADPDRVRARRRERYSAAPEIGRAKSRRWRAANPDRRRNALRSWRASNPERHRELERRRNALKSGSRVLPITKEALRQRLSMFGGCWVCDGAAEQIDHVKPLAVGGPHILANLRPICALCNQRKGARWPFARELEAA